MVNDRHLHIKNFDVPLQTTMLAKAFSTIGARLAAIRGCFIALRGPWLEIEDVQIHEVILASMYLPSETPYPPIMDRGQTSSDVLAVPQKFGRPVTIVNRGMAT